MKIAIIGATGCVGSSAAFHIAMSGIVDEMLLIGGSRRNVLEHHAIDLGTAAAEHSVVVTAGEYTDLVGADIVINAAGSHQPLNQKREDILTAQTDVVKSVVPNIKKYCPEAIIISAINPIDPMIFASYLAGGFHRSKLIGYSINDTTRFRLAIAKTFGVSLNQVEAAVIGEHGPTQVPLFSSAKIDGKPIQVGQETRNEIKAETPKALSRFESLKANRTAGWTCAVGLLKIVRAIIEDNRTVIPSSVLLDGEYGVKDLSMAVPVILGKSGVEEILEYHLSVEEMEAKNITVQAIQKDTAFVKTLF